MAKDTRHNPGHVKPVRPWHADLRKLVIASCLVSRIDHKTGFFPDVRPGAVASRLDRIEGPRTRTAVTVPDDQGAAGNRGVLGQTVRREKPAESAITGLSDACGQCTGESGLRDQAARALGERTTSHTISRSRTRKARPSKDTKRPPGSSNALGCPARRLIKTYSGPSIVSTRRTTTSRRGYAAHPHESGKRLAHRLQHGHESAV